MGAFAQWREGRRKRRGGRRAGNIEKQDTSAGDSEEQAAEREQAAKRTMSELNWERDAERKQADNVQENELY